MGIDEKCFFYVIEGTLVKLRYVALTYSYNYVNSYTYVIPTLSLYLFYPNQPNQATATPTATANRPLSLS